MEIRKVGVAGAGVMGRGVAQNLARTRHQVVLLDVADSLLERCRERMAQEMRFQSMFKRDAAVEEPEAVLERVRFTTDPEAFGDVQYVIENVTEKWEIKKPLYERLDAVCPAEAVFASNTSAIPITRIASATTRADKVIGIHFMNPVPLKDTVEVIRGYHTSEETIEVTRKLLEAMGKEGILVNDAPGFVSNRVLMLTVNEAIFLVQDQVAPPENVDRIFKSCFGHKMGPLETADLIGLDTILYSLEVLYDSFNDSKYRPSPLLKKMVDAGLHGRKSGKGFYDYPGEG